MKLDWHRRRQTDETKISKRLIRGSDQGYLLIEHQPKLVSDVIRFCAMRSWTHVISWHRKETAARRACEADYTRLRRTRR